MPEVHWVTAGEIGAAFLAVVGLLVLAVVLTARVCRCDCQRRPTRSGQQIRRRIPPARRSGRYGHLPMFVPGQARPLPPLPALPPLAATAVQPRYEDRGGDR